MIQNVLRNYIGIDVYGVVSLCLFVSVFAGAVIWAMTQKKSHLDAMARLPLEAEDDAHPQPDSNPQLRTE